MTTASQRVTLGQDLGGVWTAVGCLLVGAAMQSVVVIPPGWLTIGLAALATAAFARDRSLGWIPAGMLVALALPFARGGDVAPLLVFGFPLRPQDAAVILAFAGGAWGMWRHGVSIGRLSRPAQVGLMAFLAFGVMGAIALGIGLLAGHAAVDVLRDARWWSLYLIGPVAILSGVPRAAVLRAVLVGITLFSVLILVAALLPRFEGALKDHVYIYDGGLLRMQFGNSVMLIPAIAYALWRVLQRPAWWRVAWLALLFGAQLLSLTRMSIFVTGLVVVGVLALYYRHVRPNLRRGALRRIGAAVLVLALSLVGAVGLSEFGTRQGATAQRDPENPLERITFRGEGSDFGATVDSIASGGRFATYWHAFDVISTSPVVGGGFGQLVDVAFAYNEARARNVGQQPGVDNAYLTVGIKSGVVGMTLFGALLLVPLWASMRPALRRLRPWYLPTWLGIGVLTMTQGFAVSSYGPLALALLAAVPFLGYTRSTRSAATDQR